MNETDNDLNAKEQYLLQNILALNEYDFMTKGEPRKNFSELKKKLKLEYPALSPSVYKLVKKGFLKIEKNVDDKKSKVPIVTEEGKKKIDEDVKRFGKIITLEENIAKVAQDVEELKNITEKLGISFSKLNVENKKMSKLKRFYEKNFEEPGKILMGEKIKK